MRKPHMNMICKALQYIISSPLSWGLSKNEDSLSWIDAECPWYAAFTLDPKQDKLGITTPMEPFKNIKKRLVNWVIIPQTRGYDP